MIRHPVQIYPLQRFGNLLCLNASVVGPKGDRVILRLLVDTGATYTIFPVLPLQDLGYRPDQADVCRSIVTASGKLDVPFIRVRLHRYPRSRNLYANLAAAPRGSPQYPSGSPSRRASVCFGYTAKSGNFATGDRTTKWGIVNRIWRGDRGLWRSGA